MSALNSLDDLLKTIPGLRKARRLSADQIRLLLDRSKGQCTWCGGHVPKGRRTWCSDACVTAFNLRCSPQHQTAFVMKRDGGICRVCGRDTVASEKQYREAWAAVKDQYGYAYSQYGKAQLALKAKFGFARGGWREVDHEVPVILGGGLCTVDKLRLVCGCCHAELTAGLAKKRAGRRSRR